MTNDTVASHKQPQSNALSTLVLVTHGLVGLFLLLLIVALLLFFPGKGASGGFAPVLLLVLAGIHLVVALALWLRQNWGFFVAFVLDAAIAVGVSLIAQSGATSVASATSKTSELDQMIVNFLWSLSGGYSLLLVMAFFAWALGGSETRSPS